LRARLAEARAAARLSARAERRSQVRLESHKGAAAAEDLASQRRLNSLARRMPLAEERERRRIAVEIHDHLSQDLALIKMKLGMLRTRAESTDLRRGLEEIAGLLDPVLERTRALTFELSPPVLYELGLDEALEWLAERLFRRHGIAVRFQGATGGRRAAGVPDEVSVLLFQATRELLANIVKHAGARHATVRCARGQGRVVVTVTDDGRGFDSSQLVAANGNGNGTSGNGRNGTGKNGAGRNGNGKNGNGSHSLELDGVGLFGIRTRLEDIGGRMDVRSRRGAGTEVTLSVPLAANGDAVASDPATPAGATGAAVSPGRRRPPSPRKRSKS
jgi:signal transduction histidine kinase